MTENVIVSIQGQQVGEDDIPQGSELVTPGTLVRDAKGRLTLTYEEGEMSGMDGTTTVIYLEGERVTVERRGTVKTQMVFQEGLRHAALYEMPLGGVSMVVTARRVHNAMGEQGGELDILYTMELDNAVTGQNRIKLSVCPIELEASEPS